MKPGIIKIQEKLWLKKVMGQLLFLVTTMHLNSTKFREQYQDFGRRVERWIYDNLAGLPYWNHSQVMVVKYEDLIDNAQDYLVQFGYAKDDSW